MTPAMFDALVKRKEIEDTAEYARTGMICAAVINFSMCRPDKPVAHTDFIPGYTKKERNLLDMSPEDQAAFIKSELGKKIFRRK